MDPTAKQLLRRLARFSELLATGAPDQLVELERAGIKQATEEISPEALLSVAKLFNRYCRMPKGMRHV